MSTTQTAGTAAEGPFPSARRGYDRARVDEALARLRSQLGQLQQQADSLIEDNRRLRDGLDRATARATQVDYSGLGDRAQEILRSAEEQAREIIDRARHQAATIDERARQEFAWRRRQMRQEQELLSRRKQAVLSRLTSLSALAVQTAESLPELPDLNLDEDEREPLADSAQPDAHSA